MISVVVCSADSNKFRAVAEVYQRLLAGTEFEIIRIADARGLCEGYTRGMAQSAGDLLIFSHDDVNILCDPFPQRLLGHLDHCDLLGVAGTTRLCDGNWLRSGPPYVYGQVVHFKPETNEFEASMYGAPSRRVDGMQALDGVFLCCKRQVVEAIGFDQQTFKGFHLYDLDFSFRGYLAGYKLAVCNDLDLLHYSGGIPDANWAADAERFRRKHRAALAPILPHKFIYSAALVATVQEALALMRPPHWKD